MDFHHLKIFLAAARHLNYTRAGEELRLQQPTISAHIKQLEAELGVKLFEHLGKRLILTEAGRLLEPIARRAILGLEEVQLAADEYRGFERGSLHLAASTTPGLYILPRLLAQFSRHYPNIALHMRIANTETVERMVLRGEADFGFVGGHIVADELDSRPWLEDRVVLILSPSHRLASKRQVNLQSLTNEPLILREQGSATRVLVERELEKTKCVFKRSIEFGHPEAIKEAVINGIGIAFISRFAIERDVKCGDIVTVPIVGFTPRRQLQICYRREKHLSKVDTVLIAEAEDIAKGD